jgi:hypothetical protein
MGRAPFDQSGAPVGVRGHVKRRIPMLVPLVRAAREARRRVRMRTIDHIRYFRTAGPDRIALERGIFPAIEERPELRGILFVGTEWYTREYPTRFADREFWTMDIDKAVARYGAPRRHVVDSIERVRDHFDPGSLDAIICHGVFGAFLSDRDACDGTFAECFEILRPGGIFILGWSELPDVMPHHPDSLPSLQRFERFVLPPFTAWRHPTFGDWRVVIDFYRRPTEASG